MNLAPGWPRLAAVIATVVGCSLPAYADGPRIRLDGTGCKGLDVAETERLLDIELSQYVALLRVGQPVQVHLACDSSRIVMSIREPAQKQDLSREEVLPPLGRPGRERTAAIKIAQQFLVAWLEILTTPSRVPQAPSEPSVPRPVVASSHWEVGGGGSLRVRDLALPFFGWRTSLRAGVRGAGRWSLFGVAALERDQASRNNGDVITTLIVLGAGMGWRSQPWGNVSLAADLQGTPVIAHVAGHPRRFVTTGNDEWGLGGEFVLAVGPAFTLGSLRLTFAPEIGLALPGMTATVDGGNPVRVSGLFLGAALTITGGAGEP